MFIDFCLYLTGNFSVDALCLFHIEPKFDRLEAGPGFVQRKTVEHTFFTLKS